MRTVIQLVLVLLGSLTLSAQTISYFNQGFLRQGSAVLDRLYLGIGTVQTNWNIASITNAGTAAYSNSTAFAPSSVTNLAFAPATNSTAGIVSALGYTPATNGPFNDTVWVTNTSLVVGWPFVASTCSITGNAVLAGFSGVVSNMTVYGTLSVTNATATTWTLTVPASVKTPDGVIVAYCTNRTGHEFNFKIGPVTNMIHFPSF